MNTVIVLANGGRASARDLYFTSTVSDFSNKAQAKLDDDGIAKVKDSQCFVRIADQSSQASVSQNYIFGGVPYDGDYEVTPTASEQKLNTANKLLKNNVTVHEVPYYETTNESGGYTVSILS